MILFSVSGLTESNLKSNLTVFEKRWLINIENPSDEKQINNFVSKKKKKKNNCK